MAKHGASALQTGDDSADRLEVARYTPNANLLALQGTIDRVTFRRDGVALPRVEPRDPRTPLQRESRRRMEIVADAWGDLTPEEGSGWARYAEIAFAFGLRSDAGRRLRAYDLFCGLGCKLLQVHGGTHVPRAAPARPFLGDALTVLAEGFDGGVRYRSNGPNGPDALTELLLQPLKRGSRTPQPARYRTQAFVGFSSDESTFDVTAKPGAYAVAVRYVLATTGQASPLVPLGTVVVPPTPSAAGRLDP